MLGVQLNDTLWGAEVTPFPETGSLIGVSNALLMKAILPFTLPAVTAVNVTLKLALCPTGKVNGSDGPVMLNPAPETVA